jgi:hypothetical protein
MHRQMPSIQRIWPGPGWFGDQEVGRGVTSMKLRDRSVREEAAEQSFRTKANLVTPLGRVPDLPGSFKTPANARSETARILFRASGPVCFQVFRSIVHGYVSHGPTTQHRIFSRSLRDRWQELASRWEFGFVTHVTFFGHFRCP